MKFRTEVNITPWAYKIKHSDTILTIGSCFSESIASLLLDHGFDVMANPFGTVFNPHSISKLLQNAIVGRHIEMASIHNNLDRYFQFDYHSSFNSSTKETVYHSINQVIDNVHNFLSKTTWIVITLGSAFAYKIRETNVIVSNCHKVPNSYFEKHLMSQQDCYEDLQNVIELLKNLNPTINIILTVSPVRHIKDGIVENNVSKAILLQTSFQLSNEIANVHYFSSYEIMLDDLRDYRFYKEDMIHPTQQAIDYIWTKFCETTMTKETINFGLEKYKLVKNLQHRPISTNDTDKV